MDNCVLKLDHLVFDEINFRRVGFKNANDLKCNFSVNYDEHDENHFIASLQVSGKKEGEYEFVVRASGYFELESATSNRSIIMHENSIAILFPYVRSQITLLTSQPELDPIVLPPTNIAKAVEGILAEQDA